MARRRKSGRDNDSKPEAAPKAAPTPTTSLADLFKAAGVATKPTKPSPRTLAPPGPETLVPVSMPPRTTPKAVPKLSPAAELRMLNDAYAGARPLANKARHSEPVPSQRKERVEIARADDSAARARLAALVAGGVRFKFKRDLDYIEALRSDASSKLLARVIGKTFSPDATLDLHGHRTAQVADLVASFVRTQHRRGARQLLIIAGKGLHSEGGVGVLRDATVEALTQGFAAPLVLAFASAHAQHGGSGALAVLLG